MHYRKRRLLIAVLFAALAPACCQNSTGQAVLGKTALVLLDNTSWVALPARPSDCAADAATRLDVPIYSGPVCGKSSISLSVIMTACAGFAGSIGASLCACLMAWYTAVKCVLCLVKL